MAASPHLLVFLVVALAASGSNGAVAAAGDHDDVQLRKVDLSQAIEVLSRYRPETTDAETLKRAVAVVNREAQRYWKPIFNNVNKVMHSGANDCTKEEAFAAAKALLNRELGQGPDAIKMDFEYV
ncbi:uncharacterized protein LOC119273652 [Triticum dicoccoides]|uniref:uncharacterized protein LOC119273648 n=1 Tax=Triticum dicoccoides TaxID=85692 RepID=UPI000E7CE0D4|nr:uncharacterized protein LOC119273648 [Triticum dicoccoides]XP_037410640.1 uncharacterized protein LOC119273649 [Triticum dicoccoides]XP_037410641.1 uncharacterized protein LOC119273650 [Triticum dicoccoides]XP_037410642.1 uncharacterized protein LOC119273652 [Triticum dicoccoides]